MSGKCVPIMLRLMLLVVFAVVMAMNYLGGRGLAPFKESIGNISRKFPSPVTPDNVTFSIWGLIYLFLAVIVLFAMMTFCLSSPNSHQPLYRFPYLFSSSMLACLLLNLVFNVGWIFAWNACLDDPRVYLLVAAAALLLSTLLVWSSLAISLRCSELAWPIYLKHGRRTLWWFTRLFVENGLGFYCAWTFVASNIAVVLPAIFQSANSTAPVNASSWPLPVVVGAFDEASQSVSVVTLEQLLPYPTDSIVAHAHAATLVFSVLIGLVAVWLVCDTFLLNERYTFCLLSPGLTLLWAFSGVYRAHFAAANHVNQRLIVVLMAEAAGCVVIKTVLTIAGAVRSKRANYSQIV